MSERLPTWPHPVRSRPSPEPRARGVIRQTITAIRDLPGEIMLGIEARAELARARAALDAVGWRGEGTLADDVAELATGWAEAARERSRMRRMRRVLADVVTFGNQAVVDRVGEYLRGEGER